MDSIRLLYDRDGPWASVYMDVSRDTEDAADKVRLRWAAARERLVAAGADPATVQAVERAAVDPGHAAPGGLAMFAAHGDLVLTAPTTPPPSDAEATWSALPHVTPLLAGGGERVRWLRAVVDRTGGDLESADIGTLTVEQVADYPMRKVEAGGWSQSRYQRSAEVTWQRNQQHVADRLHRVADRVAADVLVVAGEVRARQALIERLPTALADRVVETDAGSRTAGADRAPLDDMTAEAIRQTAQAHRAAMLEAFQVGLPRGRCAVGLAEVVAAAQQSRISALLVNRDVSDFPVWLDPHDPLRISLTSQELTEMGVPEAARERAGDAVVASALASCANLMVVDRDEQPLADGLGAILRYPLPDPMAT
jgi:hypothetical protein